MRLLIVALALLLGPIASAQAEVSVSIGIPGIRIGINVPAYPRLVRVPNYPVYYSPQVELNYFFYDGAYWVFHDDNWYASTWYNGPWQLVERWDVPLFVLRVPVRYYRQPPPYFRGWSSNAPPRWNEHWGREWEERRGDWDRWDRRSVPKPAPLPTYQRQYSRDSYPQEIERQHTIRSEQYRYQPREPVTQRQYQDPRAQQRNEQRRPDDSDRGDRDRGDNDRGRPNTPPGQSKKDKDDRR